MKLLHLAKSRIFSGKGIPLVSISDHYISISIIIEFLLDLILRTELALVTVCLIGRVISINKANIYFFIRSDYPQSCRP
jgi:hypothetical protein